MHPPRRRLLTAAASASLTTAMTDLAGGQIDAVLVDAATAGAYYTQGVRAVATTDAVRSTFMPDVPTLHEEGLTGFALIGWFAAYAPAGTPGDVVAILTDMIRSAVSSQTVADVYATFAMEPFAVHGAHLDHFQRAELDKWGQAVRAAGLAGTL